MPDPNEEANLAIVTGTIVENPVRDNSRDGDPVTVLLISFAAPDVREGRGAACCEVEVPDAVADRHRKRLKPGGRLMVFGQMTGAGGLWAKAIVTHSSARQGA
jgi:hypothetical protein